MTTEWRCIRGAGAGIRGLRQRSDGLQHRDLTSDRDPHLRGERPPRLEAPYPTHADPLARASGLNKQRSASSCRGSMHGIAVPSQLTGKWCGRQL